MQINLSGHHVELTDAIRNIANEKFQKIASHYPHLDSVDVYLTVEKHEQKVEATTQYRGATLAVQSSKNDLYAAIGDSVRKLESALSHRKGITKANLHEKPILEQPEEAIEEEPEYKGA